MVLVECYDHIYSSAASSMSSRVCNWVCRCYYVCVMVLSCFAYLICICVYIRCLIDMQSEWWIITAYVYGSRVTPTCFQCWRQVFIRVCVCVCEVLPTCRFNVTPLQMAKKSFDFHCFSLWAFPGLRARKPLRKWDFDKATWDKSLELVPEDAVGCARRLFCDWMWFPLQMA